ncbi:MAG: hypothetical protein ACTSRS_14285 [Candidatus Helarchaeota archaeon]
MISTDNLPDSPRLIQFPPQTSEQRLFWEIIFLLPILVSVGLFGFAAQKDVFYTWILSSVFGINIFLRFILINEKGDWIFFLLGVFAGGGNDLLSMLNGVYTYTSLTILPFLNGLLPLWMILFWGQVFLIFRKIFHLQWFKGPEFQKRGFLLNGWVDYQLLVDLAILISLRIVIYQTYMDPWLPAAIYAGLILFRFILFPPKKNELFIIAILPYAFIFEGLLIKFGLYIYRQDHFLGMPLWLLLWWIFLVPLLLKEIFDRLEYFLS